MFDREEKTSDDSLFITKDMIEEVEIEEEISWKKNNKISLCPHCGKCGLVIWLKEGRISNE